MEKIIYLLIAVLLLVGCVPSAKSSTPVSSATLSLTPTVTLVPTSMKTLTIVPDTQTATILVTSTPSRTPTVVPPNFSSFLTAQVSWRVCDGAEEPYYKADLSPDGNWLAVKCHNTSGFIGTKILRLDGTLSWEVSFYETYGKFQEMRDGEIQVVQWSKDGNYAYFVPYFCCADAPGNIFFNYFQDTLALYRLDLASGKVTTTLQSFKGNVFSGYSASLSPNDRYLTYVSSKSPREIYVNNLQTGDTYTLTIDEQFIASGNFVWFQDSNRAIYVAVKSGWSDWNTSISNGISYFLLDLKTKSSHHLFDQQNMFRVSWTQDGNIILHDVSGKDGLLYNFQNNGFTAVTATPRP